MTFNFDNNLIVSLATGFQVSVGVDSGVCVCESASSKQVVQEEAVNRKRCQHLAVIAKGAELQEGDRVAALC